MTHGTCHAPCASTVVALCHKQVLVNVLDLTEQDGTGGYLRCTLESFEADATGKFARFRQLCLQCAWQMLCSV